MYKRYPCFIAISLVILLASAMQIDAQVVADFTYTISPVSGCAPVSVNFTSTSTGAITYSWSFGNGNVAGNNPTPSTSYLTANSYTVTLTASNGGSNDVHKEVITVYGNPTAAFTINPTTVCLGQSVSFTDNSTAGSSTIASWAWDFGDGNNQTITPPAAGSTAHTYISTGTFPVSLIVTNTPGCTNSILHPVTVINSPVASFTATPLAACSTPLSVTFTNSSTIPGGVATYSWSFGDGGTSTLKSPPPHSYNSFGNYSVQLVVTDQGCSDTLLRNNYIVLQNIVPDFVANNTTVCLGQSVSFTDMSNPLTVSRTWAFGDGNSSTVENPSHTYAAPGTYTVSLLNANGCGNNKVKPNYITVLPLPVANFTVNDSTSCSAPLSVNFTDESTGAVSWNWSFGDGNTSNSQNPSNNYLSVGSYPVSLTITDVNGCTTILTKNNYINISPTVASFTATPLQGCIPLNVNFTSTSQSVASPITSYHWYFGNGTTATTATPTTSSTYTADATYTVKLVVTSASGCSDSITQTNYIKAGTKPTPNFSVVNPVICYGTQAQFVDMSSGADSAFWEFDVNQGTFSTPPGAILPYNPVFHAFADTGIFYVRQVVFNNGCADSLQRNAIIHILPPKPEFSVKLNCKNPYSVSFTNNSEGADSIVWKFGDATVLSNANTPTHLYAALGPITVSLTAFNFQTGCSSTVTDSFTVAQPIARATIVKDTTCYGVVVTFTNTSQDAHTVLWKFGDGASTTTYSTNHIYNSPGLDTAQLIITDVNGCKDTLTRVVDVQGPIPNFMANKVAGCTPLPVTFTDKSKDDSTLTNWTWNFGDGSPLKATTSPIIVHTYTVSGVYTVTMNVTDKNGCVKTDIKTNYIAPTFPLPSFVADTFACKGNPVVFDASATSVVGPALFKWNFGDGNTGTGVIVSHTYTKDSLYTVKLTVTDINGCDSTLSHFIHIQEPKAAFTYSVISAGCGNSKIQFTDQTTGLSLTNWKWSFGDLGSSTQQDPIHTYTLPGYYAVSLIVTNIAGCMDTVVVDSIFVQGPIGSFSFTPTKGCIPLLVTFTANSKNATFFKWDFGDGNAKTTVTDTAQHIYTLISTPTPSLILGDTLKDGSLCTFPATPAGQLTITSAVTVALDSSFNNICNGFTKGAAYTTTSGGTMPYTYSWSTVPVQTSDTAQNLPAGTFTLMVTDANFCHADTVVTITQPTKVVTATGPNDTICPNTPSVLTATATGGAGNYTYTWQPGAIVNNGILNSSPANSITYTVTAYDKNNCPGTPATVSDMVYSLTPLNITMSSTSPICPGRSSLILATVTGLTGHVTYHWNPFIGSGPGTFTVTPAHPTTYYVTVENSCDSVVNDSVAVLFNPPPTINFKPDTAGLCYHKAFKFIDSSVAGNPADPINSWLWNFGDGSTSTLQSPSHTYAQPGIYAVSLKVTTGGGCTNNNSPSPSYDTAFQYPAAFFVTNAYTFDLPFHPLITNNSSIPLKTTTYKWDFGDGTQSAEVSPTHQYTSVGVFQIKLLATSLNGCTDTSSVYITTSTDIVFPNAFTPNNFATGGKYNITSTDNNIFFPYTAGIVEYDLQIFNRWGQLVFRSQDVTIGWDGFYHGQLCEQGVYVWKATGKFNNGKTFTKTGDVTLLL